MVLSVLVPMPEYAAASSKVRSRRSQTGTMVRFSSLFIGIPLFRFSITGDDKVFKTATHIAEQTGIGVFNFVVSANEI